MWRSGRRSADMREGQAFCALLRMRQVLILLRGRWGPGVRHSVAQRGLLGKQQGEGQNQRI